MRDAASICTVTDVAAGRMSRRRLGAEIGVVLGLSFGASAAYSVVSLANKLTREQALSQQTTSMNNSLSDREVFDLIYQLMAIFFDLLPVALVAFLLWQGSRPHLGAAGRRLHPAGPRCAVRRRARAR